MIFVVAKGIFESIVISMYIIIQLSNYRFLNKASKVRKMDFEILNTQELDIYQIHIRCNPTLQVFHLT